MKLFFKSLVFFSLLFSFVFGANISLKASTSGIVETVTDEAPITCSFSKGAMVATPNGEKAIEELMVGDEVLSYNMSTKQIEIAKVLELSVQHLHGMCELGFNSTKIKVSQDYPFFSSGKYYSVEQNDNYTTKTKPLVVGQKIDFLVNGRLKKVKLNDLKKYNTCENTYTIKKLDRNSLFFVNGACVLVGEGI